MKMSQIDTENDENPKISSFSMVLCIFPKFLTDFVNWKLSKWSTRKHVLSSMLRKEINADLQTKAVRN